MLADWCRVSATTARLYKSGVRQPSKAVLRLFILHRDQQVLTSAWRGWRITGDHLVSPEGIVFSQGRLRAYQQVYALATHLAASNRQARAELDAVEVALDYVEGWR